MRRTCRSCCANSSLGCFAQVHYRSSASSMFQLMRSRTWVPAFCRAAIRPLALRIDSDSRIEVRLTANCEASSISRGKVEPSCHAPFTIRLAISRATWLPLWRGSLVFGKPCFRDILSALFLSMVDCSPNYREYESDLAFDSTFYVGHINPQTIWEDIMARQKATNSRLSRRTLLQASAATFGAAAFPLPAIAQSKPFAGVT